MWIQSSSAQIPINGFCKFSQFAVSPNYNLLSAIDYNSDGYRDIVVYNPTQKKYSTLTANSRSSFGNASEKYSSLFVSAIHSYSSDIKKKKFILLSRGSREAGIAFFSSNGGLTINSRIKMDGFPSAVDVGKTSENSANIILAGAGINGLVVCSEKNRMLNETERIKGKIFSSAVFVDLNYDGVSDIAAIDLISNSIVLYNNDLNGSFEESRSIGLGKEVSEFQALDFNSDRFTDLAYIKNNKLEILLGDSVSSFQKRIFFPSAEGIYKYSVFDYNGDGLNDVAYINKAKEKLLVAFAKSSNSYYPPVCYIKKNNIEALSSYVDRGGRKLVSLSSDGNVYLISSLIMQDDSFDLSLHEGAAYLQAFDYNKDGYKEIAFIDAGSHSLKFGLSERRNLFRTLYTLPISTNPNVLLIDDTKKNVITFIGYEKGNKVIEVLRFYFENNKTSRQVFYTSEKINEVKFVSDRLKDRLNICALTLNNKILSLQEFELRNFKQPIVNTYQIASNVENATFNFSVYKDVYALVRYGSNVDLVKIVFNKKEIERVPRLTFELKDDELIESRMISVDELLNRTKPAAALLSFNKKSVLYFFSDQKNMRYETKELFRSTIPLRYSINNSNALFYTFSDSRKVLAELNPKEKSTKTILPIESEGINDYFVTTLHGKNKYLIFSNSINNSITIKKYL